MVYSYPCCIEREGDEWLVRVPDVPEVVTGGSTYEEARALAGDALVCALGGYVDARWDIPAPGALVAGQILISVPTLVSAKLSLYTAMRRHRITKVELARRLGVGEAAVRRMVDLDHRSRIDQVERALHAVGRALVVDDRSIA